MLSLFDSLHILNSEQLVLNICSVDANARITRTQRATSLRVICHTLKLPTYSDSEASPLFYMLLSLVCPALPVVWLEVSLAKPDSRREGESGQLPLFQRPPQIRYLHTTEFNIA